MSWVFSPHFCIKVFDEELATKLCDVTPCTFGQHPAEEVGFSLVDQCFGRACYRHDPFEELVEATNVIRARVLAREVEFRNIVAEVVLFRVQIERDTPLAILIAVATVITKSVAMPSG